ncbi:MAG TPA: hypothetical protein VMT93_07495 [Gemmatimonadaceae bacterium]|nr:hypothetical protein [Gemmatimonadaceae bacterium]
MPATPRRARRPALAACLAAAAVALAAAAARPARAQATGIVDEGTFTISRAGRRAGRETFAIRRVIQVTQLVYEANATVDYEAERLTPALRTDTTFFPLAYQIEIRTADTLQLRLKGVIGRGRFTARVRTPAGESAKEYIVSDGAVVVDDRVFHQYYFLAQRMTGAAITIPVVVPQQNAQVTMRVRAAGADPVVIAGARAEARKLVAQANGGPERDIWVDAQGRVLKVTIGDVTAVRDALPR